MGKNIITTVLERLKLTNPFRNEKAGHFLMYDDETKEVSAVPEAAILAKVNSRIDGIIYPDGFTKTTEINRVGNTVTIAPFDFEWRIQLNPYTNADEYTKTFDATESSELKRIDTLAATTDGTIVYHRGEEDEFFVKPPRIPTTQLRLSDFSIFGDDVQEHTEPIISEVYTLAEKEKLAILDPTADIDKPVSTAQAAADSATLASANSYTDSKVTSVYKWKGSVANYAALPSSGNTIGDVWDLLDTGMNYGWTGSGWDALGTTVNISGKEDISNKTDDIETNKLSSLIYTSAKAVYDWGVAKFKTWILGINPITGITYTIGISDYKTIGVFSNANPIAFTVPTNASVAVPIGTTFEYSVQGAGTVTVGGAGITFVQKNLVYSTGNAFVLKKIDIDTWVVDGNPSKLSQITDDVGVMPNEYGVVYLSSSGNDSTALLNNPNRPYLTLDSAMNAVRNNANINVIKVLSSTTFSTTVKFPQKNVIIKSDVVPTLNFNAIGNGIDSGGTSAWTIIDCPNGIVNFTPASATLFGTNTGSDRVYLRISCYNMTISNFSFSNINVFNLNVSNVLTFSGTFIGTLYGGVSSNSIIKLNRVTSSAPCTFISQCATFGGTVYISFNSISTTSTFSLITVGVATIDHGNFTSTNATAFSYLGGSNSGSSFYIDFKNDATIDGKIQIGSFNSTLYISFKGNVTFTTTDSLFANQKSVNVNIIISNARFILPGSIMGGNRNGYEYLEIVNSYLEIGGVLWAGTNVGADVGSEPTKPTVRFKGVNTVKTGTDGATIVGSTIFSTFHPYVEIWGKLYSNGIIQATIPVNKYTAIVEI